MFESLVESSSRRKGTNTGWFFFGTFAIYVVVFTSAVVGSILMYSPNIAETFDLKTMIAPPPPPPPPPPAAADVPKVSQKQVVMSENLTPKEVPKVSV